MWLQHAANPCTGGRMTHMHRSESTTSALHITSLPDSEYFPMFSALLAVPSANHLRRRLFKLGRSTVDQCSYSQECMMLPLTFIDIPHHVSNSISTTSFTCSRACAYHAWVLLAVPTVAVTLPQSLNCPTPPRHTQHIHILI
jgi:hypothetical protein